MGVYIATIIRLYNEGGEGMSVWFRKARQKLRVET